MEFQHDQSWNILTAIFSQKLSAKDAWNKLLDEHEKLVPKNYWTRLRTIDVEAEQTDIVNWLHGIATENQIPATVVALWIGIVKFEDGVKETSTIYLAGADSYDKDDIDWACEPNYLPENRYAQLGSLLEIDDVVRADETDSEFLDWILPLAYCAFTFDEIARTKLNKRLFLQYKEKLFIAAGHDDGDYLGLTPIEDM